MTLYNNFFNSYKYGKFKIDNHSNIIDITNTISKKSNIDYKLTIVEGWEYYQLSEFLLSYYSSIITIPYDNLIADTYYIDSSNSFEDLHRFLLVNKKKIINKYLNNIYVKKYGIKNILIIASLVEKEAKNDKDKSLIASVIFNRLDKKMKLQIDATVISAITKGHKKFNRELTYKDLKYKSNMNTYYISGLPDNMICYIGPNTLELILDNYKSDFLFYFYNILEEKHIFSKNYKEHSKKLNEYRKQKK